MRWNEIWGFLKIRPYTYVGWLAAGTGGLLLAYVAALTVWTFHRTWGNYLPRPEGVLIAGTISLAVTGMSYRTLRQDETESLSPILSESWPLLLALVYGALIAMGVKTPMIGADQIWAIVTVITFCCYLWSSLVWLHIQGVRFGRERTLDFSKAPPEALIAAAADLPKIEVAGQAVEENQDADS